MKIITASENVSEEEIGWASMQRNSAMAFPGWQFNALHAYYRVRPCFRYSIKLRGHETVSGWEIGIQAE